MREFIQRWTGALPACAGGLALALWLAAAMPAADEVNLEDLFAREESARIEALAKLIDGAMPPRHGEQLVAKLLEQSWAGRHRARWCFAALMTLSDRADDYLPQFMVAQSWLDFNATPPAVDSPERTGPPLPAARAALSQKVWQQCIRRLVRELGSDDEKRAGAAELALERMAAPVDLIVPILAATLNDDARPAGARRAAAMLIGRYGRYAGSTPALIANLRDHSPAVRLACALALGQLGQPYDLFGAAAGRPDHPDAPAAAQALLNVVTDADPQVALAAMNSLQSLGVQASPATADTVGLFLDSEARLQDGLLAALAAWGSSAALPAFAQMLASTDTAARVYAAKQLNVFLARYQAEPAALDALGTAILPALEARLADDPAVTVEVARACARLGSRAKSLREPLLAAVRNRRQQVHLAVLFAALCRVDPTAPAAVEELLAIARPEAPQTAPTVEVREQLALALGSLGHPGEEAAAVLAALLEDPDSAVRLTAVAAVAKWPVHGIRLEGPVAAALERLAADNNPAVRKAAAAARASAAAAAP